MFVYFILFYKFSSDYTNNKQNVNTFKIFQNLQNFTVHDFIKLQSKLTDNTKQLIFIYN